MMRVRNTCILGVLFSLLVFSCKKDPRFFPDISEEKINIPLERFDVDFFHQEDFLNEEISSLKEKYDPFYSFYCMELMGFDFPGSVEHVNLVGAFLKDSIYGSIYKMTIDVHADLSSTELLLNNAFKRFNKLFPDKKTPRLLCHYSGFGLPVILMENTLSVSLESYLGQEHEVYDRLGEHQYMRIRKSLKRIAPDCMLTWLLQIFPYKKKNARLIDDLMYEGKLMLLLRTLLPEVEESMLYAFTEEQMRWCEHNRRDMWEYMVTNKHLYTTDRLVKRKYTGLAPSTSFFPEESPGRAAVWLAEQFVLHYMKNKPEVSWYELMTIEDGQEILQGASFRP